MRAAFRPLVLASGIASMLAWGVMAPAHAQPAPSATGPEQFAREAPKDPVDPGPLVQGRYEIAYQENMAQTLRLLGFPSETLAPLLSDDKREFSYVVTGRVLTTQDSWFGSQKIELGKPTQANAFGMTFSDHIIYFDQPDRLVTSFVAPNGRRVWSVRKFTAAGLIDAITIDGEEKFVATRVWKRLLSPSRAPGVSLL